MGNIITDILNSNEISDNERSKVFAYYDQMTSAYDNMLSIDD
jgi:hypothetical protein